VGLDGSDPSSGSGSTHGSEPEPEPDATSRAGRALAGWLDYYPPAVKDAIGLDRSPQHDALAVADLIGDVAAYETAATDVDRFRDVVGAALAGRV